MAQYGALLNLEPVSQTTLTNSVDLGTRRNWNGAEYIYIYNDGGASITSGYGVTCSLNSGYSVTVSSVTQINVCFGVCTEKTIATAYYGWVMTKGYAQIVMSANNSAAAGDNIRMGTDGLFAVNSVATGYIEPAMGVAVQAIASAASGKVYFRTMFS